MGTGKGSAQSSLWTPEQLMRKVARYRCYFGENGGITVSGGEPLMQIEFLTRFFALAKAAGIHTALDTAGSPFTRKAPFYEQFERLMQYTDLILLDLKEMDSARHKALIGVGNENILEMARWLSAHGKEMWIRHVLVPGLTDDEKGLLELRDFIAELKTVSRVEILPYHALGVPKWEALHIPYRLKDVPAPTEEEVRRAEEILGIHHDEASEQCCQRLSAAS